MHFYDAAGSVLGAVVQSYSKDAVISNRFRAAAAAAAAAEELSKSEERLRESHSECKRLKEEKARMEVVVRMLEAEVKEVSGN